MNEATASPALMTRFEDEGAEPFRGNPADLAKHLAAELQKWRDVVRTGGLKLSNARPLGPFSRSSSARCDW